MSIKRIVASLAVALALAASAPCVYAQREIQNIPPLISSDGGDPDYFQPFIDPGTFNYDMQFFAPVDITEFGGGPKPNTGFFATYDKLYLSMSRPQNGVGGQPFEGDFVWGNRYDLGYMTEEDHGWLFSYTRIDDVGYNTFDGRSVRSSFDSVEFNKTYRVVSHHGTVFEPFIGARYVYFRDLANSQLTFFNPDGNFDGDPDGVADDITTVINGNQTVKNQLVAGQLGFRASHRKGRFTLSSDVRVALGQNFQNVTNELSRSVTVGAAATGTPTRQTNLLADSFDSFVPMGELRVEASYQLFRDLSLRAGLEMNYLGRGVARADVSPVTLSGSGSGFTNFVGNDQDLILVGTSFGIVWNR